MDVGWKPVFQFGALTGETLAYSCHQSAGLQKDDALQREGEVWLPFLNVENWQASSLIGKTSFNLVWVGEPDYF